jgi:hypothetical protein
MDGGRWIKRKDGAVLPRDFYKPAAKLLFQGDGKIESDGFTTATA